MNDSSAINEHTDYYELIGVEETVDADGLKKAYRKAAMKWHPDRNHGNVEEATRVFQLLEHAYSILSDPHERAWYDGHRNAVVNDLGEFSATNVDIESYFNANSFHGFNDGPNGFYTVFREAFRKLSEEEKSKDAPSFGSSDTPYEKVNSFYSYWTCFTTKRSFAFEDIFRLKDAPNSRYKRAMSKENEKARQKAQREFVQSVRELALFAKKRDPRVKRHLDELEREKEERQAKAEQQRQEKRRKDEEELQKIFDEGPTTLNYKDDDIIYLKEFDNEDQNANQLHCEYCGRDMTTESAFIQHCKTKKHKKMTQQARKDFLNDNSLFEHTMYTFLLLGLTDDEIEEITGKTIDQIEPLLVSNNQPKIQRVSSQEIKTHVKDSSDNESSDKPTQKGKKQKQRQNDDQKRQGNKNQKNSDDDQLEDSDQDSEELPRQLKKNQNNKNKQQPKISKKEKHKLKVQKQKEAKEKAEQEQEEMKRKSQEQLFVKDEEADDGNQQFSKLSKKDKKKLRQLESARQRLLSAEKAEEEEEVNENVESGENEEVNETEKVESTENHEEAIEEKVEGEENEAKEETNQNESQQQHQQKGKKQKNKKGPKKAPPGQFMCRKCHALFPSKTKLFKHLEETKHATAYG